jgi:hypothetical protein
VCREFGLVNSSIQTIWKKTDNTVTSSEKMDHELGDCESLKEVALMKHCYNGSSNKEAIMYKSAVLFSWSSLKNLSNC